MWKTTLAPTLPLGKQSRRNILQLWKFLWIAWVSSHPGCGELWRNGFDPQER